MENAKRQTNRKSEIQKAIWLRTVYLDFYCPEIRLCIELDGGIHKTHEQAQYDEIRSQYINENNIKVLGFENDVVYRNINAIVDAIKIHKKMWEEKKDWRGR